MTTKDQEKRTSIKLKESTLVKLKKEGMMTETYDELINRLFFVKKTGGKTTSSAESKISKLM